jgi:hypothetical protein
MNEFFLWLLVIGVVALAGYNGYMFYHATGSTADRFGAAFKGSVTAGGIIWTAMWNYISQSFDQLCDLFNAPELKTFVAQIETFLGPDAREWLEKIFVAAVAFFLLWARFRKKAV